MSDSVSNAQGAEQEDPDGDPREIITPHAFEVDEDLLGTPLAAPWRRLAALGLDLAVAGFIANVAGGLVGILVAYVFYRVATRSDVQTRWKRWTRGCLVTIGAVVLFAFSIALVRDAQEWGPVGPSLTAILPGLSPDTTTAPDSSDDRDEEIPAAIPQSARLHILRHADDRRAFDAIPDDRPLLADTIQPERGAALLRRYAQALAARDSARLDTLTPPVQALVAGPRLEGLYRRTEALEDKNEELAEEAERLRAQVQNPSLRRMARATANDLGITVGWVGLYFTLFLAWWGGRTPGKYLLGIRVVRLNGEPLSLWFAFERFGGYAAGLATGLLGFVQLYWDPNRQGIHDRVARTVVVCTRASE